MSDYRQFPMAGGAHATPTGRRGTGAGVERLPGPKGKEIRGYERLIERGGAGRAAGWREWPRVFTSYKAGNIYVSSFLLVIYWFWTGLSG